MSSHNKCVGLIFKCNKSVMMYGALGKKSSQTPNQNTNHTLLGLGMLNKYVVMVKGMTAKNKFHTRNK
jgi:hypothetical protein